jgi:ABC-2 type transport system ATP-binding protein
MSADAAIRVNELTKSFDGQPALDGMTFTVPRGSICGFLGPNGAGKTTTLRVLLGLAFADG